MNPLIKTAVVPVAGLGTRLIPITLAVAKELLPLGSKPALQYIVEELGRAGIQRVIFVSSEQKPNIANLFQRHKLLEKRLTQNGDDEALNKLWSRSEFNSMEFETTIQSEQLGLGHAVLCSQTMVVDEPIVVALGDCVIGVKGASNILQQMRRVFESNSADVVIAFEDVPDEKVERFGIAKPKRTIEVAAGNTPHVFELEDLIEKPSIADAPSNLAVSARYIFSPRIFEALAKTEPGKGNEIQLTDAIRLLIKNGGRAFGVQLGEDEPRFDVGNIHSYTQAFIHFAMTNPEMRNDVLKTIESFDG